MPVCSGARVSFCTSKRSALALLPSAVIRNRLLASLPDEALSRLLPKLSLGISGQLLASTHEQSFSIRGLPGMSYGTDAWAGWLGGDVSVQLW